MLDPNADTSEYPPMPSPHTNLAVTKLVRRMKSDGKYTAFDPTDLFSWLMTLISLLAKCENTPRGGFDLLTWKPERRWWDFLNPWAKTLEERLYDHRMRITAAARKMWTETQAEFHAFITSLWSSIDAGDLTPELLAGMYAEAKARG